MGRNIMYTGTGEKLFMFYNDRGGSYEVYADTIENAAKFLADKLNVWVKYTPSRDS